MDHPFYYHFNVGLQTGSRLFRETLKKTWSDCYILQIHVKTKTYIFKGKMKKNSFHELGSWGDRLLEDLICSEFDLLSGEIWASLVALLKVDRLECWKHVNQYKSTLLTLTMKQQFTISLLLFISFQSYYLCQYAYNTFEIFHVYLIKCMIQYHFTT